MQNIFTEYGIFTIKKHVQFWCERLILKCGGGGKASYFQLIALFLTLNKKNLLHIIFQCYVFLAEQLSVSYCFYCRVKINVVMQLWACYQTSTKEIFFE
jgi:hypothetical protein